MRGLILGLLVVAACSSQKSELSLLEEERLRFRAENERVRVDDLELRYKQDKQRADAVNEDLLELSRERDRLWAEYDKKRGELARLDRDAKAAAGKQATLSKELQRTQNEVAEIKVKLAAEQKALDGLEKKLEETQKKRAALAKGKDAKNPG